MLCNVPNVMTSMPVKQYSNEQKHASPKPAGLRAGWLLGTKMSWTPKGGLRGCDSPLNVILLPPQGSWRAAPLAPLTSDPSTPMAWGSPFPPTGEYQTEAWVQPSPWLWCVSPYRVHRALFEKHVGEEASWPTSCQHPRETPPRRCHVGFICNFI